MKKNVPLAKQLRKDATDTEKLLWKNLRAKHFEGLKWRRQVPIGNYIADFVCFEKNIIIECDGGQHATQEKDIERDQWLRQEGYQVLRFWNNEIMQNMEGVLQTIVKVCQRSPSPLSPPLQGGECAEDK